MRFAAACEPGEESALALQIGKLVVQLPVRLGLVILLNRLAQFGMKLAGLAADTPFSALNWHCNNLEGMLEQTFTCGNICLLFCGDNEILTDCLLQ